MKSLKAKLGKANGHLSSPDIHQLRTLLQVKEGSRMQLSPGAECSGGHGKEKLMGKEFCHCIREQSALLLSFQQLLERLNLDILSTP